MMRRLALIALTCLAACLALAPGSALASEANDFGPWYPAPGSFGSENPSLYQANVQPTSDNNIAEIYDFSCTYPSGSGSQTGQTIPESEQAVLGAIFDDASAAYNGTLADSNGVQWTTTSGPIAMQIFLQQQRQLLERGGWWRWSTHNSETDTESIYATTEQKINTVTAKLNAQGSIITGLNQQIYAAEAANDYAKVHSLQAQLKKESAVYTGYQSEVENLKASIQQYHWADPALAHMINVKATAPLYLAYSVPEGCGLNPITGTEVHFLDLINNPSKFFTDLILYIPTNLAQQSYNFLQPYAFIWTFWTPHTERGDTLFNVATGCAPEYYAVGPHKGSGTEVNATEIADSCSAGVPLGFNKTNNTDMPTSTNGQWYISIAIFLQWFVSGFYFIILFAAAILYMVRGNRNTQLNVLNLIPKLLASALLTMFAPFLIGMLITFSNLFVVSLFSYGAQRSVGNISDILLQSNTYITVAGSLVAQLIQCLVAAFVVFYFALFILGSLVRQLLLMALVIGAPVAAFCLIVPKWAHNFNRYVRLLVATIFIPPAMAFVLKMGIAINPIVADGGAVNDLSGLIGLLLMVATLWAMAKVLKVGLAMGTGHAGFNKSIAGRTMGKLGEMAGMAQIAGIAGGPLGTLAMGGVAKALNAGARMGQASETVGASLIPEDKKVLGGLTSSVSGVVGAARRRPQGLVGGGYENDVYGSGPEYKKASFGQRYQEFLDQRLASHGERRIPHRQAMAVESDRAEALAKREERMGRKLTRSERDEFLKGSYVRDGDGHVLVDKSTGQLRRNEDGYYASHSQVVKRKGNYFMVEPGMGDDGPLTQPGPVRRVAAKATAPVRDVAAKATAPIRDAASAAALPVATAASRAKGGVGRTRVADIDDEHAGAMHEAAEDAATDPGLYPDQQAVAQQYLDTHSLCPHCGGAMVAGKCVNPACHPPKAEPEGRRRRRPQSDGIDRGELVGQE
jgi:hypothetical protein